MKPIALTVWREPAACIGLLTSVAILVVTLLTGDPWDSSTILAVIAPLASSLGIRQLVSPAAGPEDSLRRARWRGYRRGCAARHSPCLAKARLAP